VTAPLTDPDSGVTYHPHTDPDSGAVGFRCEIPDRPDEFIMLNPSSGSDDDVATVFLYLGPTGDPSQDDAMVHFVIGQP
jgi:hypothetical protein